MNTSSSSSSRQDYSSEYFRQELATAEQALAALTTAANNNDSDKGNAALLPIQRLARLTAETQDMLLLQAVTRWGQEQQERDNDNDDLMVQTDACVRLANTLEDNSTNVTSALFDTVYRREYLPLYEYLSAVLIRTLRQTLHQVGYNACQHVATRVWPTAQADDAVGRLLDACERLDAAHDSVHRVVHATAPLPETTLQVAVVTELVRPIVTRVHYHFVQANDDRPTSTRLDRLAEWLFKYLRDNFFQSRGPWHVIYYGWRPACFMAVLNEIARLVQFVLDTKRQLFRSQNVVSSTVLCRSIQEILQFDAFLQSWVVDRSSTLLLSNAHQSKHQQGVVVSLTDSLVAGDVELLDWWLEVERESLSSQLHAVDDESSTKQDGAIKNTTMMAPQAEVFGAMIRSIRTKAALFTSRKYLQQVAGPLCMQFLDAVHDTATALKEDLLKLAALRSMPSLEAIEENLHAWLALLNGTQWCVLILKGDKLHQDKNGQETEDVVIVQDDLVRFGHSLERLHQALVADVIDNLLGETLLLQKAKLANYLMQLSHVLAGNLPGRANPSLVPTDDMSVDLLATQDILSIVLQVCRVPDDSTPAHYTYAHQVVREGILQWTASKFLEALLDESLVTEILAVGGRVIHKDVQLLLGGLVEVPQVALRLLDVTHTLQDVQLASIGDALCGLAGQPPPLTTDLFALDERLYDEAVSMIRAKGWLWLDLQELLSVLNRRVDLSQPMAF